MTTPKLIMFCAFCFIIGLITSHIMAGTYLNATDSATMNALTVIRTYNVLGLFTIPWLNADFFLVGIPRLIMWDFGFFGGEAEILKYFFYVITIGVIWGIFPIVAGILSYVLRR